MFTLKTLIGRVYVQLLTYEDVSVCITLTLSPRLLTNVLLKTRSHTRAHVFLTGIFPLRLGQLHIIILLVGLESALQSWCRAGAFSPGSGGGH